MTSTRSVLHIAPTPFFSDRGCHIRIAGIEKSIGQLGYDNVVCTYHHGRDVQGIETRRIKSIKSYTQTAAGPSRYKLLADWRLLWLVFHEVRRTKPDVIHAHLHEGLMIGLIVKGMLFWRRVELVADMQGSLLSELEALGSFEKRSWLRRPVRLIEAVLMRLAKTVVCSSPQARDTFIENFKLSPDNLHVVQDGADPTSPMSTDQALAMKKKLGIADDQRLVIYTGGLVNSKGLGNLQEIILACRDIENIHFIIVGYPTENLKPFLEEHGLTELCTLTGQVPFEELSDFLQLAEIAIDPKPAESTEGSGKMLNYLASGLPVLAFDTQNNREFLPTGTDLATQPETMVQMIGAWLKDPALLADIRARNLEHFTKHFSWDKTVQQLHPIYKGLAERG